MENVKLWQWIVIAGPAFLAGCVLSYWICRDHIMALEDLVLAEPVKNELTSEQIAKNLLGVLYDHR